MGQVKGGAMAAILNAPAGSLDEVLEKASSVGYVDVANYNSPAQVVITGDEAAVAKSRRIIDGSRCKKSCSSCCFRCFPL